MVDFAASSLGTRDIKASSTFLVGKDGDTPAQEYTVTGARRMAETGQLIACHPESYPYAVFMCHLTEATRAYKASSAKTVRRWRRSPYATPTRQSGTQSTLPSRCSASSLGRCRSAPLRAA
uniref:BURP domain-containing protein n=1 Tax=Oryza meridionalis TaxID=40149 RepID=A0A0E0DBN2_9ORYZ